MDSASENQRSRFSYIPFSGGPRQCIGDNFSRLESVLLLATLAQRFQPVPIRAELPKPEFLVLARPAGGVPMILRRRAQRTDHGRAWA
jgi:cytochrome P450